MALLEIVKYPEPSLSEPSVPVKKIDDEIKLLIENMGETMFDAPGVGLAAPQVGINKRVMVYNPNAGDDQSDEDKKKQEFRPLINPKIISATGSIVSEKEACLSVPDFSSNVKRYKEIIVKALNIDGKKIEFNAEGILSIILQHEIDHLDGILFIDRISALKRALYKKKMKKKLRKN